MVKLEMLVFKNIVQSVHILHDLIAENCRLCRLNYEKNTYFQDLKVFLNLVACG